MKKNILIEIQFILSLFMLILNSCGDKFLEVKYSNSQVIPKTVPELQSLLDNEVVMNFNSPFLLGIIASDEYYVDNNTFSKIISGSEKNAYVWNKTIYDNDPSYDWDRGYKRVLYSNLVIEGLEKLESKEGHTSSWKEAKGSALFYRGSVFFYLSQLFCLPYDESNAKGTLGLPLKVSSNIEEKVSRANLEETMLQIEKDLKNAVPLLSPTVKIKTRPSRQAAYAMLARLYLQVGDYQKGRLYADSCLSLGHELINYNQISSTPTYPFSVNGVDNKEIILLEMLGGASINNEANFNVHPQLYDLYLSNDKRKTIFWKSNTRGSYYYRGAYSGNSSAFTGITTAEILLIRAECSARMDDLSRAMLDLNTLLKHRILESGFSPYESDSKAAIVRKVLLERRLELVCRGIRWWDLRRLNKEVEHQETLTREIMDKVYTLSPGDNRYAFPLPEAAISLGGLEQNIR